MTVKVRLISNDKRLLRIRYGDEIIAFERLPRESTQQKVLIKVHPDLRVQVRAPASANDAEVTDAVRKRARWISSRLKEFGAVSISAPKRYVSGESHLYLGKRHVLKVWDAPRQLEEVKLYRGHFEVHTASRKGSHMRKLFEPWYRERAAIIFQRRLEAIAEQALWLKDIPRLQIRTMNKQWGSCSPNGRLTLNLHLIKTPRECIDYVILHELCHLAEHNHSRKFYRLMGQVMPNWSKTKQLLDNRVTEFIP